MKTNTMITFNKTEHVRICRYGVTSFSITAVWAGVGNTTEYSTTDWRAFLSRHEWTHVPRVWDIPRFK